MLTLTLGVDGQYARLAPVWYRNAAGELVETAIEIKVLRVMRVDSGARVGIEALIEIDIQRHARDGRLLTPRMGKAGNVPLEAGP